MTQPIDIHLHIHLDTGTVTTGDPVLEQILTRLATLDAKENIVMADLTTLTAEVQENADVVDSAVTLLGGLAQQIRDLSTDPAALAALADSLDASTDELAAAVAANTPAAAEPGEEPA